jgi:putative SOS response-associated peptidase YedK
MCYRFTRQTPAEQIADYFDTAEIPNAPPRFNIALSQAILALRPTPHGNQWVNLKFGLIPRWSKEAKPAFFGNARSETVFAKPAFRDAVKKRRCLVPADGFYEWEEVGGKKLPWLFRLQDSGLFAFAGIWESWTNPQGEAIETCALLTTTPNELISPFHDRMPVILTKDNMQQWIDTKELTEENSKSLFQPIDKNHMQGTRVDPRVNSPRYEAPDCVTPVDA